MPRRRKPTPMGWGVPTSVERAFRDHASRGARLRCGILAHGFARVRCTDCGHDRLLAFSCKGRGVCPACNARRMAEVASAVLAIILRALQAELDPDQTPAFALAAPESVPEYEFDQSASS